jgi:hypothetical protein
MHSAVLWFLHKWLMKWQHHGHHVLGVFGCLYFRDVFEHSCKVHGSKNSVSWCVV